MSDSSLEPDLFSARKRGANQRGSKRSRMVIRPLQWLGPGIGLLMFLLGFSMLIPRGHEKLRENVRLPVDRSLPTIVVDAGHGGHDRGASGNSLREKDMTLDVALRLERQLRSRGFPVVMTRRDDRFFSLPERVRIANRIPRALFVSIHFNDSSTGKGQGIETFFPTQKLLVESGWSLAGFFERNEPPPADQGAAFAQTMQSTLISRLGAVDRGAKTGQLYVVSRTRCPAVLVEGGFLNNSAEARNIARPEYRESLANAIAEGVMSYHAIRTPDPMQMAQR